MGARRQRKAKPESAGNRYRSRDFDIREEAYARMEIIQRQKRGEISAVEAAKEMAQMEAARPMPPDSCRQPGTIGRRPGARRTVERQRKATSGNHLEETRQKTPQQEGAETARLRIWQEFRNECKKRAAVGGYSAADNKVDDEPLITHVRSGFDPTRLSPVEYAAAKREAQLRRQADKWRTEKQASQAGKARVDQKRIETARRNEDMKTNVINAVLHEGRTLPEAMADVAKQGELTLAQAQRIVKPRALSKQLRELLKRPAR